MVQCLHVVGCLSSLMYLSVDGDIRGIQAVISAQNGPYIPVQIERYFDTRATPAYDGRAYDEHPPDLRSCSKQPVVFSSRTEARVSNLERHRHA